MHGRAAELTEVSMQRERMQGKGMLLRNAEGATLGPFDCWMAMCGLMSITLRMLLLDAPLF
jgi:cystathionine beta-lyase/cystathionine gamma-synthase